MRPHWRRREQRPAAGRHENIVEGVIQHHGRFAFLLNETPGGSDVFLRGRGLDLAMDGDRVRASVRQERNGRVSGEITAVVKRAKNSLVGLLRRTGNKWFVVQEKGDAPPAEVSGFAPKLTPVEGDMAVLEITRWPTVNAGAAGKITEILGGPDSLRVRISAVLRARGINEQFPGAALEESAALPPRLSPEDWKGREELFNLPVFTIDGADARDFDDAVSLENIGGGAVRLGVHIADVSHYVKANTPLDKEAYSRATSVYLPDRVVPMLPEALSNNLCSLVPHQERLTLSAFMDISHEGKVVKRRLAQTVILSCRRFTYDEVQELLDGKPVPDVSPEALEAVKRMGALAKKLYELRVKRGALDFNLPEYKVETDAHGKPLRVELRPRLASHRLIEEFMLLANEAVATELLAAKSKFLHRRHDEPDAAKLKSLADALDAIGIPAKNILSGNIQKALQQVLKRAQGHLLEDIINSMIVRSMRQAIYSPQSQGHFGLAARAYTHFTSPIRRYPDLLTHRAVKALLRRAKEGRPAHELEAMGAHCSERERTSADAEYKAVDLMRAELFKDKIGTLMDGIVTAVTDSGAYVQLGKTGAEGLLRGSALKPGDKLTVRITGVDASNGNIDIAPEKLQTEATPPAWRVTHWKKRRR